MQKPKRGDHIQVFRGTHFHHAIYEGNGVVIHFSGETNDKENARIKYDTLKNFADGGVVCVVDYDRCYPPDETIRLAKKFLHRKDYSVFSNNCEHFCTYCKTGDHQSDQIDALSVLGDKVTGGAFNSIPAMGAKLMLTKGVDLLRDGFSGDPEKRKSAAKEIIAGFIRVLLDRD